ncbi:hypothetical protein ACKFKG_09360 [Phormidesmis sp. 146-35]
MPSTTTQPRVERTLNRQLQDARLNRLYNSVPAAKVPSVRGGDVPGVVKVNPSRPQQIDPTTPISASQSKAVANRSGRIQGGLAAGALGSAIPQPDISEAMHKQMLADYGITQEQYNALLAKYNEYLTSEFPGGGYVNSFVSKVKS